MRRLTRAATKSDLVVVLAVIAVAAAIVLVVMPALRRPPPTHGATACAVNLRQSGLSLLMYMAGNKSLVPIASGPGERGWVGVVAQQQGYSRVAQSQPVDDNELKLDHALLECLRCPVRSKTSGGAFIDYVSNGMDPKGPDAAGVWSDPRTRRFLKAGTTTRPSSTVLLAEAEQEEKVTDFNGIASVKTAREQWQGGPSTWNAGGTHAMTVWKGGHLPQGKNGMNVDDEPGPRMVTRWIHGNASSPKTNLLFQDGHVERKPRSNRPTDVQRYADWLRLFGVKDADGVAQKDNDLY